MLGKILSLLSKKGNKKIHIPYRDSFLTKILSNALGGNSKTYMLCTISPGLSNYKETLNTLNYAVEAKKIKNQVSLNITEEQKHLDMLKEENRILKKKI